MIREMASDEIKRWNDRVNELRSGNIEDSIMSILMNTKIGGFGEDESAARAKAKEIIKCFNPINMKEHLSAVSQVVSNFILLRLSLSLVKRKLKTLDYFLDALDKSITSLTKINIYSDLFLEENIDYLKNLKNLKREEISIIIEEIERRKDSLEDYEKYQRKKI